VAPAALQVLLGVQLAAMQMCFVVSHVLPIGHAPQSSEPSQPSPIVPQYWPPLNVHETFVQLGLPHTPLTFAPHAVPIGQVVPQSVPPPQPSPIVPQ
jgi:hypothetical protein